MPLENDLPLTIVPTAQDLTAPDLAEHVISSLGLHGDFRDRLIVLVAEEIDNLAKDRENIQAASSKAQCSTRRVKAIAVMNQMVGERDQKEAAESAVALVASLMRHVRDTLREVQVEPELVQTILTTLMGRVVAESQPSSQAQRN